MLIFWLLNRGLAPLRQLAAEAAGVSVNSWDFVPPERARMIKELAPLTNALETVLTGLEHAFMQQRRFVGDAAHELKTAVAVLKSSLQLLTLKQRTALEYEQGIERCQLDCERLEETVAKMLTLARAETNAASPKMTADLAEVLRRVSEQFESMAELKHLKIILLARGAGDGRRRSGAIATLMLQPALECAAAQSSGLASSSERYSTMGRRLN